MTRSAPALILLTVSLLLAGCTTPSDEAAACFPYYIAYRIVNQTDQPLEVRLGLIFPDETTQRVAHNLMPLRTTPPVHWGIRHLSADLVAAARSDTHDPRTATGDMEADPSLPALYRIEIQDEAIQILRTDQVHPVDRTAC